MARRRVYVCSPYAGDVRGNTARAAAFCREIITKYPNALPIAPHLYFPQFLDDRLPLERETGMAAALELLDACDELWVFGLDRPSRGMREEIRAAFQRGIPIRDGFEVIEEAELPPVPPLGAIEIKFTPGVDIEISAEDTLSVCLTPEMVQDALDCARRYRGQDVLLQAEVGSLEEVELDDDDQE